ncbi:M48 family metalloprotease [Pararhodospirillum oryzae]|uniref:Peptidase M48 n=1 Tax=Pararhodospirillum oryzae TaxID=478448 RepID=A0A512H602_9PROT|nr:M48 family metalloprotease [Pararhodospirillum oryzae]GEO80899.1 peptidase M48 [Pararhodospirillum oryzae]
MRTLAVVCLVACLAALAPGLVQARSLSLIRDAEIERTIATFSAPLLRVGGFGERAVTIRVLNDDAVNAFATTESRIFINSGLLLRADGPDEIKGVIAHEIGHLAGGHLLRLRDQVGQSTLSTLVGALAGAAAGVAAGRADVGGAVALGAAQMANRDLLSFTRLQENSADAFAMRALDATGQSTAGMLRFFNVLKDQEALMSSSQDAYNRTHPLTSERMDALAAHLAQSPLANKPPAPEDVAAFARLKAKLFAFLRPPSTTLATYPASDTSVAGRYARAIAHYRRSDLTQALPLIDALIAEFPRDPWFHEMRAQMLFEHQRLPEARLSYAEAARLAPTEPLLLTELAHVDTELGEPRLLEEARTMAKAAVGIEPDFPFAWRQLANAHGRLGDEGRAAYALAEMALAQGDPKAALEYAKRAQARLAPGTPEGLRLQDLIAEAERQQKRDDR